MITSNLRLSLVVLLFLNATGAVAQTTGAATLVGTVTDATGAVAPAARVTVVNIETAFRSETQTGPEGNYYVPYLSPGTYQVTVEAAGFKMGPFRLMDLIGNDVNYAVSCSVYEELGRPIRLQPSSIQEQKVKNGELGRKTGRGYYLY